MQSKNLIFLLVVVLISCLGEPLLAQRFSSEVWHNGEIVLLEGDTLTGRIMYNMESQTVQFSNNNETIQTFSPRKLLAFDLYDEILGSYRVFYILPFEADGHYTTPYIFEVLFMGERISLLRTEKVETVVRSTPYIYGGSYSTIEQVYSYYFVKPGGEIKPFDGKKSSLFRIMGDKSAQIRQYVKENNMNLDRVSDLMKICSYYNSL
jgi:hypothetical protein